MKYAASSYSGSCCGVEEIGSFCESPVYSYNYELQGNTPKEFLESVAKTIEKGIVLHIWFVKPKQANGKPSKSYEWAAIRTAVKKIPGVVHMGTTINPNTGNRIDGYSWINKGVKE